jgi:hypothetical protein
MRRAGEILNAQHTHRGEASPNQTASVGRACKRGNARFPPASPHLMRRRMEMSSPTNCGLVVFNSANDRNHAICAEGGDPPGKVRPNPAGT